MSATELTGAAIVAQHLADVRTAAEPEQTPWRTQTCSLSTTASISAVPCERSSIMCQSVRDSPSGCDTVTRTFPGEP